MGRLFFSTYISSNKVWLRIILYCIKKKIILNFNIHSMIKNFVVQILIGTFFVFSMGEVLRVRSMVLKTKPRAKLDLHLGSQFNPIFNWI